MANQISHNDLPNKYWSNPQQELLNSLDASATVMVVQTGGNTCFGQTVKHLSLRPPEMEFERGIRKLGYLLTKIMLVLIVSIFAINILFHKPVLDSLLFSIALAVGLTPQLLPAIININLSKGILDKILEVCSSEEFNGI